MSLQDSDLESDFLMFIFSEPDIREELESRVGILRPDHLGGLRNLLTGAKLRSLYLPYYGCHIIIRPITRDLLS